MDLDIVKGFGTRNTIFFPRGTRCDILLQTQQTGASNCELWISVSRKSASR